MQFSNTTNNDGIIQQIEFWTSLGQGVVSGDAVLLKAMTGLVNDSYDEIFPLLLKTDTKWRFDDYNYSDFPIGKMDIRSGTADYNIISDANGNSILDIEEVYAYQDATTDQYSKLNPIDSISDPQFNIYAENPPTGGIPAWYTKIGTSIFLKDTPDYNAADGLMVVFRRAPNYFVYTDTTKTPGIPAVFHRLLPMIASLNWILVNKPESSMLVTRLEKKIADSKADLGGFMSRRSRDTKPRVSARQTNAR